MSSEYEKCREALNDLSDWYKNNVTDANRNEATTRLQLIDRLFFECLGWKKEDCKAEEPHGMEYTDYSLCSPHRSLIIEAKKEGIYFELPAGHSGIEYSIKNLCRDNQQIGMAIKQAMDYCQKRGTLLGAVCNGHQIICFVASRNDGIPPKEGKSIVFSSLDNMLENFFKLWQYLSNPGVRERNLLNHLTGINIQHPPAKLSASILSYPGIKNRNIIQTDLQIIGELVIEDVSTARELEADFIKECFCSSGALSQYALVSKTILENRYASLFDDKTQGPILIPSLTKKKIAFNEEILAESLGKRPILLLGDVGVGKTMFVRYLIKVAGVDIIKDSIALYLDLGSKAAISTDLRLFFLLDVERQLMDEYSIDIYERNFVRGVYHAELIRFSKGIFSDLKESNPQDYKEKELQFLHEKTNNKENHTKECLQHLYKGRKKQIVFFLDNADQRSEETQQEAFLIAQEIAVHWPVTVFLSIRPQTFHKSKKTGALSGYHPKAFTISPPRVDDVINKRLKFALKIAEGKSGLKSASNSSIESTSLQQYLKVLLYSFDKNRELIEFIDNVCNGNIRLALEFITTFIGSGHVDTQKILEIETNAKNGDHYLIPLHEFLRAVIYGDNKYYNPQTSDIVNVFDITIADPKEHFLLPIIIEFINRAASFANLEGGFVETSVIYNYAQNAGFNHSQVSAALNRGLQKKLLESEARQMFTETTEPRLYRTSTVGIYHIVKLIKLFIYIDAISVDTPITDDGIRSEILDVDDIGKRLSRATSFCNYLDNQWRLINTKDIGFNWQNISKDLHSDIQKIQKRISR